MKVRAPSQDSRYFDVKKLIHGQGLNTICEEARCPNIAECWGRGTATFQILGDTCTRACRYCYVHCGRPDSPPDPLEPLRLATRRRADGAEARRRHLGRPRRRPRPRGRPLRGDDPCAEEEAPDASVEVLTPDFLGVEEEALQTVIGARPDVFNHNIETVRRLHARMRGAKASYDKALWLLAAREGDRRLSGADEVRDHRRPRRDERRSGGDDARPARARRRRRHDRPVPAAELEARADRPLGASRTSSAGSASRARRSASARSSPDRSFARRIAPTSRGTLPRPAAAQSRTSEFPYRSRSRRERSAWRRHARDPARSCDRPLAGRGAVPHTRLELAAVDTGPRYP